MPRRPLIRSSLHPYHITTRSNNRDWFALPLREVWQLAVSALAEAQRNHGVQIEALVLMSNHYHLLVWTPQANLDRFMHEFNYKFSHGLRLRTGRINRVFGDRYKWCLIRHESYYRNVLRYIYQNPLRAGLVGRCEDYPFSTLHFQYYNTAVGFPLYHPVSCDDDTSFQWFNQPVGLHENLKLGRGLKRAEFKLARR